MALMSRPSLYSLRPSELASLLGGSGRARRVWAIARCGGDPFAPGALGGHAEALLGRACEALAVRVAKRQRAACGTVKLLLELDAGGAVETVLIPQNGRTTVCVSSQLGCARACGFCVTASMGLSRSLDAGEIVAQVKLAVDETQAAGLPALRNVVFMGMGEPLDNLAATRRAIEVLIDPHAFAIAPGHVTLSTVGTGPAAILEAGALPVRLAWSLHSADDEIRLRLVPTSRHPLSELRDAFVRVVKARRTQLFVEVTLMDGVNDSARDADVMARFLAPVAGSVRINLLAMNPGRSGYAPSPEARTRDFQRALRERGYFCSIRRPRGAESAAACGQLAT